MPETSGRVQATGNGEKWSLTGRVEGTSTGNQTRRSRNSVAQVPLDQQGTSTPPERKFNYQPARAPQEKESNQAHPKEGKVQVQKQNRGKGEATPRGSDRRVPTNQDEPKRAEQNQLRLELPRLGHALAEPVAIVEPETLVPARQGTSESAQEKGHQLDIGNCPQ